MVKSPFSSNLISENMSVFVVDKEKYCKFIQYLFLFETFLYAIKIWHIHWLWCMETKYVSYYKQETENILNGVWII